MGETIDEMRARVAQEQGERMLGPEYFRFEHLPEKLQAVSSIYCLAAVQTCERVKGGPERTVALRKLVEAKDAAVRAALAQ